MKKFIIAGSRKKINFDFLSEICKDIIFSYTQNKEEIAIICGLAPGIDMLGAKFAKENNYQLIDNPALWYDFTKKPCLTKINKHGEKYNYLAGFNRNKEMAKEGDYLIVFWDGKSPGTKNMISEAIKRKNILKIDIIIIP